MKSNKIVRKIECMVQNFNLMTFKENNIIL